MKILIIGAGVIGVTYGWQLSLAGNQITMYVRQGKKEKLEQSGIPITCLDTRHGKKKQTETIFHPEFVEELYPDNHYDLIMVAVNSNQISSVLPLLKEGAGNTDIMFFSNNWPGIGEISNMLDESGYFFGYPFKAGGGRDDQGCQLVIFGNPITNTVLGEVNGRSSHRVKRIYRELKKADMNPVISKDIIGYLWAHFAWAAASVAAYLEAGSYEMFVSADNLRKSYLAMRECFKVCKSRGKNPARIVPTLYYYAPLFLLVPFTQLLYSREDMRRMFEGHVTHSPKEMVDMYAEVLYAGEKSGISMPNYKSYQTAVENTRLKSHLT